MQERFLYFIWQFQYFNKQGLKTIDDEALNILHPGLLIDDAGPDFTNAKIMIGNMAWHCQAEIYLTAYQLLAANFGFKVNKEAFLTLSIELYNNYCQRHKCLSCNIGGSIVNDKSV